MDDPSMMPAMGTYFGTYANMAYFFALAALGSGLAMVGLMWAGGVAVEEI